MFKKLPSFIIFPIHLVLQMISLAFWAILVISVGLIKFLLPFTVLTKPINIMLSTMMGAFGLCSVALIKWTNNVEFNYVVKGELNPQKWYLIIANHLSWLDIILLTHFTADKIPTPKFFLKKELLWLPFVGLAAWALDMPFMQRYSKAFLEKNPHLKGKDIETTKKSCEKFRQLPTTVINFVEGSRFTKEKQALKSSPFKHLLPPKAGGIAFTLATMGELFSNVLDVTIVYPDCQPSPMISMLAGRLTKVIIQVNVLPIEDDMIGNYFDDEKFKQGFQTWLNRVWKNKDKLISQLKEAS